MTRRLLQAIAGARHGGAETFFVRLATALNRAGETQRVLIRRDPHARRSCAPPASGSANLHLADRLIWRLGARFATRLQFGGRISC